MIVLGNAGEHFLLANRIVILLTIDFFDLADLMGELRALVDQAHQLAIDAVDLRAQLSQSPSPMRRSSAAVGRLRFPGASAACLTFAGWACQAFPLVLVLDMSVKELRVRVPLGPREAQRRCSS